MIDIMKEQISKYKISHVDKEIPKREGKLLT